MPRSSAAASNPFAALAAQQPPGSPGSRRHKKAERAKEHRCVAGGWVGVGAVRLDAHAFGARLCCALQAAQSAGHPSHLLHIGCSLPPGLAHQQLHFCKGPLCHPGLPLCNYALTTRLLQRKQLRPGQPHARCLAGPTGRQLRCHRQRCSKVAAAERQHGGGTLAAAVRAGAGAAGLPACGTAGWRRHPAFVRSHR